MSDDPFPDQLETQPDETPNIGATDLLPQIITVERIMRLLRCGQIFEEHGRLRWSSNYTTIVTVKDNELETLAVYKPQRGERPLWDFPEGTLCYREVAAYHLSDQLGWDIVAPTVLREGPKGLGSIQFFIDHDPALNYFSLSDEFIPQLKTLAAFDALANNTDRKGGHCVVDGRGKLWGIDHGICFHHESKLRTVVWDFAGEPIEERLLTDIQMVLDDLCSRGSLYHELEKLLSRAEIEALKTRAKRLLQRRTYPHPGPGPNYPWPPV
jgi:hypothetical protein